MNRLDLAVEIVAQPCTCGRRPKLVEVGYTYGGAWDGGGLIHYELRCSRWWFKCHRVAKAVSKSSPWFRWLEDLIGEWNAIVEARP